MKLRLPVLALGGRGEWAVGIPSRFGIVAAVGALALFMWGCNSESDDTPPGGFPACACGVSDHHADLDTDAYPDADAYTLTNTHSTSSYLL